MTRLRIGLLGGSFNPAHAGHLHISREALKRLGLDQVWWLVSPQNPLKSPQETAPYAARLQKAREVTAHDPRILVSDFEAVHGLYYTVATVEALRARFPRHRFVWIMGADNLAGFHRWQRWRRIAALLPIAVFDRAPFSHRALHARAALALRAARLPEARIARLAYLPGRWAYLLMRRHAASSTAIRAGQRPRL